MPDYHRFCRQVMTLSTFVVACAGAIAQPNELTILYTGKLLGYPRMPNVQRVVQTGWRVNGERQELTEEVRKRCEAPNADCQRLYEPDGAGDPSAAAELLLNLISAERPAVEKSLKKKWLLLGMGDNFAMDYFSRVVVAKRFEGDYEYIGKDELFFMGGWNRWLDLRTLGEGRSFRAIQEDEWSGKTEIPNDNVAEFFTAAKYDALVPGKHDFYYGPERLRQLARLLSLRSPHTQMLATNLILQTKAAQKQVEVEERVRAKKRNFETSVGSMKWSLPKTVLPWLRTFRLKNYIDKSGAALVDPNKGAELCEADDRDTKPGACTPLEAMKADSSEVVYRFREDQRKTPIASERTYLVCAPLKSPKNPDKRHICQAVDVSTPFFQYPDEAKRVTVRDKDSGDRQVRYAGNRMITDYPNLRDIGVDPWVNRQGAIVMGVVEPGIEALVGALNATYSNADRKSDTSVLAIDPSEALAQLLEYCEARGECSNGSQMVLMAQMPRDEAAVLNDRLGRRFGIVLAQADSRFSTGEKPVTYTAGHKPIVLVPGELVEKDEHGKDGKGVQLNVATLTWEDGSKEVAVTTRASGREPIQETDAPRSDCLTAPVTSAWVEATHEPIAADGDRASRFRTVVLHAMREAVHADVAVIQERDFYDVEGILAACPDSPVQSERGRMQAAIEQILWKGDFEVSQTITGAALKSTLKESERLKKVEENSYRPANESHQWLRYLGVSQDPETETWYVNGGAIDDKALYSVAMTDFLASGDTGYADLKNPAVPPGPRPRELSALVRVSEAVMRKLTPDAGPPGLNGSTYLDQSNHRAFPLPGKAGFLNQTAAIAGGLFKRHPNLENVNDRLGQTRPYWRLLVDKGEIGLTDYRHNKTTQDQLNAQFAGTSQSGVLSRKTGTLPLAVQIEGRREYSGHHYFSRTELEYTRTTTQQDGSAGRFLTTYPSNRISIESGYRSTFRGTMRSRPWNGWLLSAFGESNLHQPVVDGLTAGVAGCAAPGTAACPTKISYSSELPRTNRILAKTGFRRENEQNWFEAGMFAGAVFRPTDFSVWENGAPVAAAVCRLADLNSGGNAIGLNTCLQKSFPVTLPTPDAADAVSQSLRLFTKSGSKPETGAFLNFNFRVAVPKNWVVKDLYFEQRGSWYINQSGDSVTDARLNEKISFGPSLTVVPSLPGLSLKPTYTLFFYENKIVRNMLEGRTLDIRLDYRFDWRTGASWRQVLRYGRPK